MKISHNEMNRILMDKLNMLLEKKNMNKRQCSKENGIPYTTISRFDKHDMANMSYVTLIELANYFEVPLNYFDVRPTQMDELLLRAILDKVKGNEEMVKQIWQCIT